MQPSDQDLQFLRDTYAAARNKYRPSHIRTLLVAEAPPESLDRHFYFEHVKIQDSLFLEIMGILYPEQKKEYLASGRDTILKQELLEQFRSDGFWLIDLSELPFSVNPLTPESCAPILAERMQQYITKKTPVILLKTNVFDACYTLLLARGFTVIPERIPFPGSGQQRVFREKFSRALRSL